MDNEASDRDTTTTRLTKLETQRTLFGVAFGAVFLSLVGGALNVMLLTTRLDERYASEHAINAQLRTQVEALANTVGSLGRFDGRLTAINSSVTRIDAEIPRLRETIDQLRAEILQNNRRAEIAPSQPVRAIGRGPFTRRPL